MDYGWPEPVQRALRTVLCPTESAALLDEPLALPLWDELVGVVSGERIVGLVDLAVGQQRLPLTEAQTEQLHVMVRAAALAHLSRTAVLHDVLDRLDTAGIPSRLMKGLAAGQLLYDTPQHRQTGDIDLLVASSDLFAAQDALLAGPYEMAHCWRGPLHQRVTRSSTVRHRLGVEVDLHRRFGAHRRWAAPRDAALPGGVAVSVEGRAATALDRPELFLGALAHLSNPHRLSTEADLARLFSGRSALPVAQCVALVRDGGLPAAVFAALAEARAVIDVPAEVVALTPDDRRWERLARQRIGGIYTDILTEAALLDSPGERLRYLLELARPSAEWRATRKDHTGGGTRRWVRSVLRAGST